MCVCVAWCWSVEPVQTVPSELDQTTYVRRTDSFVCVCVCARLYELEGQSRVELRYLSLSLSLSFLLVPFIISHIYNNQSHQKHRCADVTRHTQPTYHSVQLRNLYYQRWLGPRCFLDMFRCIFMWVLWCCLCLPVCRRLRTSPRYEGHFVCTRRTYTVSYSAH